MRNFEIGKVYKIKEEPLMITYSMYEEEVKLWKKSNGAWKPSGGLTHGIELLNHDKTEFIQSKKVHELFFGGVVFLVLGEEKSNHKCSWLTKILIGDQIYHMRSIGVEFVEIE